MAAGAAQPFVLDRRFVAVFGDEDHRRLTRAICTRWPDLDPFEVSRWPWERTAFYIEWMDQDLEDAEKAEQEAEQIEREAKAAESMAALTGLSAYIPAENKRVIGAPDGSED